MLIPIDVSTPTALCFQLLFRRLPASFFITCPGQLKPYMSTYRLKPLTQFISHNCFYCSLCFLIHTKSNLMTKLKCFVLLLRQYCSDADRPHPSSKIKPLRCGNKQRAASLNSLLLRSVSAVFIIFIGLVSRTVILIVYIITVQLLLLGFPYVNLL